MVMNQIALAESNRDAGIQKALDTTERNIEGWADIAFDFLKRYLTKIPDNAVFMLENIRTQSEGEVPEPVSRRAWGGIVLKARNENLIKPMGVKQVINPKAHRCYANQWVKVCSSSTVS